jgi:hypothetical protein
MIEEVLIVPIGMQNRESNCSNDKALRAGRPTLVMPYSYDQPDNAARVARLGTSRTIDIA